MPPREAVHTLPGHSNPVGLVEETLEALQSLGYTAQEVSSLVQELSETHTDVPSLLRAALGELGKGR